MLRHGTDENLSSSTSILKSVVMPKLDTAVLGDVREPKATTCELGPGTTAHPGGVEPLASDSSQAVLFVGLKKCHTVEAGVGRHDSLSQQLR